MINKKSRIFKGDIYCDEKGLIFEAYNIKDIDSLKVTKLARGVPLGGELEYVDRGTIMHAFSGRQNLKPSD